MEKYLERFVGELMEIAESGDVIYLGKDFPDEYAGSKYTRKTKGGRAKAKANAAQGIRETENYNIYSGCLVVNCTGKGKMYLYDLVDIKKEASNPLRTKGKSAGQTWTVFVGSMGFCKRNLLGNGKGDYLWKIR